MVIDYKRYGDYLYFLYEDRVTAYKNIFETENHIEKLIQNKKIVDNAPCRLSFNVSNRNIKTGYEESIIQAVLTTPPDVDIPIGSNVEILRADGSIFKYTFSKKPSIYLSHRRYILDGGEIS